jgi:DNA-binding MarR family transcriptional regulator
MSQPASPEPTSDALAEQFVSVSHIVRQRANTQMSAAGLSLARTRALKALAGADRMRMNELSAALGVVPRTVTTLVDSLEKEGLVERDPDPHDRRVTRLRITDAGSNQLQHLIAARLTGAAALFDALTPTERRQLAKLLERIQAAADESASDPSHPHD